MSSRIGFYITTAIVSSLFVALLSFVPLAVDDLWFLDGIHSPAGWDRFVSACNLMSQRVFTDTGRLGNLVSPLFLGLFPKMVYNLLSGVVFFLLVIGSCRVVGVSRGLWCYVILAFCTICLPWYDYLLVVTYGLNYLWAGAAAVWAVGHLISTKSRHLWLASIVCFIAGWMHEGFGVPLSAAALTLLCIRRNRPSIVLTIATISGTAMTFISPSVWLRFDAQSAMAPRHYPLSEAVMQFGPLVLVLILFVAFLLWRIWRKKSQIDAPVIVFFCVYIVVATALALAFYSGPRTTMSPLLFAFIGCVYLFVPTLKAAPRYISSAVAVVLSVGICIHMIAAIMLQRRLLNEFHQVTEAYKSSVDGTLYIDLIPARFDISLYKTTVRQFHEQTPRLMFSRYYGKSGDAAPLTILPERLNGFTIVQSVESANISHLYIYSGLLVATPETIVDGSIIEVADTDGVWHASRVRLQRFRALDGNYYDLVTPHVAVLNPNIRIMEARE